MLLPYMVMEAIFVAGSMSFSQRFYQYMLSVQFELILEIIKVVTIHAHQSRFQIIS